MENQITFDVAAVDRRECCRVQSISFGVIDVFAKIERDNRVAYFISDMKNHPCEHYTPAIAVD
jgi:hypothetical protein